MARGSQPPTQSGGDARRLMPIIKATEVLLDVR